MEREMTPAEIDGTAGYRIVGIGGEFVVTAPWGRAAAKEAGLNPALEVEVTDTVYPEMQAEP